MNLRLTMITLASAVALSCGAQAQTTATCNDGTLYTGQSHQGACSHHGGVKEWTAASGGEVWVNTAVRFTIAPAIPGTARQSTART
jgi:Protein of unknown function (DUF3761)